MKTTRTLLTVSLLALSLISTALAEQPKSETSGNVIVNSPGTRIESTTTANGQTTSKRTVVDADGRVVTTIKVNGKVVKRTVR